MNKEIVKWSGSLASLGLTLAGIGVIVSISPMSAAYSNQQPTKTGNSTTVAQSAKASFIFLSQTLTSQNSQIPKQPNSSARNPLCYMVSPEGRVVNLEELCSKTNPSGTNSSKNNTNPNNANLSRPNANLNQLTSPTQGNSVETP